MADPTDDEEDAPPAYGQTSAAGQALVNANPNWAKNGPFGAYDQFGPSIGGSPGGAEVLASSLSNYGAQAQGRQGANLYAMPGVNIAGDVGQANAARASQLQGLKALQAGGQPSAATMQMGAQLGSNLGGAFAQMRQGGRLGSNVAMPGLTNANGAAIMQGGQGVNSETNATNAAINQATNNLTGADLNEQKQNQSYALANAQLQQQQGTLNDKQQLAYEQMSQQTLADQLKADTDYTLANLGDASQISVNSINNNAALSSQVMGAGLGFGAGGLGGALSQLSSQDNDGQDDDEEGMGGGEGDD